MGSKAQFLGVYIAPGVYIGSDLALYRAYLGHVRTMAKPKTGEAHQVVRAWVMIQWRLQCLAELEQEWWLAFEQGILLTEPAGEASVLDTDPLERVQVCQRAVNSWDKLQRMERRLQKEAGRLLPLLGALIAEAAVAEYGVSDPIEKPNMQPTEGESEGIMPSGKKSSSPSQNVGQRTHAVTEKISSVVDFDARHQPNIGSASAPCPGDAVPRPRQGGSMPPLGTPASGLHPEPAYPYGSRKSRER